MITLPQGYTDLGLILDANRDGGRILYDKDGNELVKTFKEEEITDACYVYGQGFKAGMERVG